MIWKNPFLSRKSAQQMKEDQYLALFDCTALQIIEQPNLEKVSFVSSTPGAGKTSLFRAFSPEILRQVAPPDEDTQYRTFYAQMERLGVIKDNKIVLASAMLSCARGYTIIDEMFYNGRRKQIFFALLNYRIAISLLKSIGRLLDIGSQGYTRISFQQIPEEMECEAKYFKDGKSLYEWACEGEKALCKYLDSERNDYLEISFVHTTLLIIKLFEPGNVFIDGNPYFDNTLIIFDDFHKLSESQKENISEAIYTLRANVGIWLGQRFEGLKSEQLITMDGSLDREYNHNIVIDNYWIDKTNTFNAMLEHIADRRVKEAGLQEYTRISDCISEKLTVQKYSKQLKECIELIDSKISAKVDTRNCYFEVLNYLKAASGMDLFEKAIWYECIAIKENRKQTGQMSFFMNDPIPLKEFEEFVKESRGAAVFYISQKHAIPYYYGLSSLESLSSYNVEQFLFFAAPYLEFCRIKSLEKPNRRDKKLTAAEQETALINAAREKWGDMEFRYTNIGEIKVFLNNIGQICIQSRDKERNSYAGGAYTGVAIKKSELWKCTDNEKYGKLEKILGDCLASKYLERREISGGDIIVFYLNRWLCLYYGLPLAYGGWKRCDIRALAQLCDPSGNLENENQMSFD